MFRSVTLGVRCDLNHYAPHQGQEASMLLSELVAALGKVNQLAGDIPVELYHLESEAKTALLSIGVHIDPTTGSTGGAITLEHGPAPTPAAAPVGEPQPNQA